MEEWKEKKNIRQKSKESRGCRRGKSAGENEWVCNGGIEGCMDEVADRECVCVRVHLNQR